MFFVQIGPGIVNLTFKTMFGTGAYLHAITPQEPLEQKIIHHIVCSRWMPSFFSKFLMFSEALQVNGKLHDNLVIMKINNRAKSLFCFN